MANYYTEFSLILKLDNPEQVEWAIDLCHYLDDPENFNELIEPDKVPEEYEELLREFEEMNDDYPLSMSVSRETSMSEHGLWIYTDESGDPEHAAWYIQSVMKKFDIGKPCVLSYGHSCSKPRIDAFGGGSVVITRDEMFWFDGGNMAYHKVQELSEN